MQLAKSTVTFASLLLTSLPFGRHQIALFADDRSTCAATTYCESFINKEMNYLLECSDTNARHSVASAMHQYMPRIFI